MSLPEQSLILCMYDLYDIMWFESERYCTNVNAFYVFSRLLPDMYGSVACLPFLVYVSSLSYPILYCSTSPSLV